MDLLSSLELRECSECSGFPHILANGLYAKHDISAYNILGEYQGFTILKYVLNSDNEYVTTLVPCQISKYSLDINESFIKDARFHNDCLFREINDYRMIANEPNCILYSDNINKKIFVMTLRDISAGEQLLVDYSFDYWIHYITNMYKNSCIDSNHILNICNDTYQYFSDFNTLLHLEIKNNDYHINDNHINDYSFDLSY
jgi:hypothetical protein